MVAAFAAPLAERGMKVGVLMGTAYLFTARNRGQRAPSSRASSRSLLDCAATVTLETGAGHASRAAVTPFAAGVLRTDAAR